MRFVTTQRSARAHAIVADVSNGPQLIGRYALFDEIASGGMASVHLGRLLGPVGFSRVVAIKRMHAHFAKEAEFVWMFVDEARIAARVRHPNVVGDTNTVHGTVGKKFIDGDEKLVEVLVEVRNQSGLATALGIATIALP